MTMISTHTYSHYIDQYNTLYIFENKEEIAKFNDVKSEGRAWILCRETLKNSRNIDLDAMLSEALNDYKNKHPDVSLNKLSNYTGVKSQVVQKVLKGQDVGKKPYDKMCEFLIKNGYTLYIL